MMCFILVYRESGVIEDDSISGDFDNFPEGKVRRVKIQEETETNRQNLATKSLCTEFLL